jgi:Transposase DDE domain
MALPGSDFHRLDRASLPWRTDILTHPKIGSCDGVVLCESLFADRYMLSGGSAWTGLVLASSGMPGWKKGALFFERMVARSTVRLRQLACRRAEEVKFGRFLRNDRVSLEALNQNAGEQLGRLAHGCRHVLAIQDTTELNFQRHARRTQGLGPVGNGTDQGLFLHPLLAIEADGDRCLGLAWAKLWVRPGKITTGRRQRPAAQKESQRWQEGIAAAERVLGAAELVTVVNDREADIYQSWARPRPANLHLLARAAQNRSLVSGDSLFAACGRLTAVLCYEFAVPRQPGRPKRRAKMEVRFGQVELRCPAWLHRSPLRGTLPDSVVVHIVDVRECGPRSGEEPPLHWRLLTTHAVETPQDALQIVQWYRQRWHIEQLFWILKRQGLDIEASQIESAQALIKLAFLATLAATRITQLVRARDGTRPTPADEVFSAVEIKALSLQQPQLEGRTTKQQNPHPAASLAWASWIIARLGGWKGYASESPPGPITMRHGLTRLEALCDALVTLRSVHR